MNYFGDSYDIVKHSLLAWLAPTGDWAVLPMFTEPTSPEAVAEFESFLRVPVISAEMITIDTNRDRYFALADCPHHVFLDPDVGLATRKISRSAGTAYVSIQELVEVVKRRPGKLVLVFDQSIARGFGRRDIEAKIRLLESNNVFSFGYVSHACFLIAGDQHSVVEAAFSTLLGRSHLPRSRFAYSTLDFGR